MNDDLKRARYQNSRPGTPKIIVREIEKGLSKETKRRARIILGTEKE